MKSHWVIYIWFHLFSLCFIINVHANPTYLDEDDHHINRLPKRTPNQHQISQHRSFSLGDVSDEVLATYFKLSEWAALSTTSRSWNRIAKKYEQILNPEYRATIGDACGHQLINTQIFTSKVIKANSNKKTTINDEYDDENDGMVDVEVTIKSRRSKVLSLNCMEKLSELCGNHLPFLRLKFSGSSYWIMEKLSRILYATELGGDDNKTFEFKCAAQFEFTPTSIPGGILMTDSMAKDLSLALSRPQVINPVLDLRSLIISHQTLLTLAPSITGNPTIKKIQVNPFYLDDVGIIILCIEILSHMPALSQISISADKNFHYPPHPRLLLNTASQILITAFNHLENNLKYLELSNFDLSFKHELFLQLGAMKNLETVVLRLWQMKFTPETFDELQKLKTLKRLTIEGDILDHYDDNELDSLLGCDSTQSSLEELSIINMAMENQCAISALFHALSTSKTLKKLYISNAEFLNGIGDEDQVNSVFEEMAVSLTENQSIEHLEILDSLSTPFQVFRLFRLLNDNPRFQTVNYNLGSIDRPGLVLTMFVTARNIQFISTVLDECGKDRFMLKIHSFDVTLLYQVRSYIFSRDLQQCRFTLVYGIKNHII